MTKSEWNNNNNYNYNTRIELLDNMQTIRYSPMGTDLALATSSLVNPFAQSHSQLASQLGSIGEQSASLAATAASILPVLSDAGGGGGGSKSCLVASLGSSGSSSESGCISGVVRSGSTGGFLPASALHHHAHRLAAAAGHLSGWCLFVYNLAPEVEENVIWKLFGPFGAVQQVNLVKDAQTNKCRGFAFVTMSDYNQALMAIQSLNGYTLANRVLQVSFKTSKVRKTMQ